jgi:predicted acylesterase/phospholipase RssA
MHVAHQLWDTALLFQGGGSRGMAQFRTGFARPASG